MIAVNSPNQKPRGLIVTGDDRVQDAAIAAMAAEGLESETATSAESALVCAASTKFALILCDDACYQGGLRVRLADLRAIDQQTRIIYLLDGRAETLVQELRKRISQALSWSAAPGRLATAESTRQQAMEALLQQASPMAALHLSEANVILSGNDVAALSGCLPGASLPELAAFPMSTWSLAESQGAHQRVVGSVCRELGVSEPVPTRLFALRCSRLDQSSLLMTACEIADADDALNQPARVLTPREERLQALEGFATGLAQEVAGMLGIVSGCSHLLRMRFPRSDEDPALQSITQPLEIVVRQGTELISRLRAFGRQGPLDRRSLNAVELMRDWSRTVRGFVAGDFPVEIESDRTEYPIIGNRQALHEAFMQLASNAIDAIRMDRKATPTIRLRVRADRLANGAPAVGIVISDNGCGIEESIRDRIFDPFFTTKPSGTAKGLGLTMVLGTVRGHGGEISFLSRVREGSEFVIRLPCDPQQSSRTSSAGERSRILLIDADPLSVEVNAHALRALGCEVVAGTTGSFALSTLKDQTLAFSAVIVDVDVNFGHGMEIAKAARSAGVATVVLLCTTSHSSAHYLRHADLILHKPCSAWDMLEAIRVFRAADPEIGKEPV